MGSYDGAKLEGGVTGTMSPGLYLALVPSCVAASLLPVP